MGIMIRNISLLMVSVLGRLVIQGPQSLVEKFPATEDKAAGVIEASYANFGLIPYGHNMMGRLRFFPEHDDMCEKLPLGSINQDNAERQSEHYDDTLDAD